MLIGAIASAAVAPLPAADVPVPVASVTTLSALSLPGRGAPADRVASERFEVVALRDPEIVVRRLPLQGDRPGTLPSDASGDAPVGTGSMLMGLAALMAWITLRRIR